MAVRVDYVVLADLATAAEGKLYIHGAGWDRIFGRAFPLKHNFSAAVRLRIPWHDTNRPCTIELDIVAEDGTSIFSDEDARPRAEMTAGRPPELPPGDDQVVPVAFRLVATFPRAGLYSLCFKLDGEVVERSNFRVIARPPAQHPD